MGTSQHHDWICLFLLQVFEIVLGGFLTLNSLRDFDPSVVLFQRVAQQIYAHNIPYPLWQYRYSLNSAIEQYWYTHPQPPGKTYNHTRIMTPEGTLNVTAYQEYSPLYLSWVCTCLLLSVATASSYFIGPHLLCHMAWVFWLSQQSSHTLWARLVSLLISVTLSLQIIHFWKPIKSHFSDRALREQSDIHASLMAKYPPVPEWYYAIVFGPRHLFYLGTCLISLGVTFTAASFCIELWDTGMTIWALIIALLIGSVLS